MPLGQNWGICRGGLLAKVGHLSYVVTICLLQMLNKNHTPCKYRNMFKQTLTLIESATKLLPFDIIRPMLLIIRFEISFFQNA